jgi:hypothetical protein
MSVKKGRGRPKKSERRRKAGEHGRKPLKLATPDIPGYKCRWFNDVGNRLHEVTHYDDYDYVLEGEIHNQVGEQGSNTDLGEHVSVIVGTDENGPVRAYLLKKKIEFHREDKQAEEERRREKENTLRRGTGEDGRPINGQYGSIT